MSAGGFANVEMIFDGKTLTLLGKDANLYTQAEVPGKGSFGGKKGAQVICFCKTKAK